ncbi:MULTISPECIES: hypothetical protein [unclassified Wenzhouxiangella]|uniref:hypothetical protein n=1 Tax=unclassified Wenzhouxiangella TaxID=2613841 RepID=UPI000E32A15C|nr:MULTISPECIES: hypothetical protein [unclassified Wenzhouxiangella]RFF27463.1 hypothetical protein DZK25_08665 [Wenzhouxiangella sp. 15181]RFP68890.1 hypothetical protein DZK26_07110 [Wenzhouxiangella sp. 15190]
MRQQLIHRRLTLVLQLILAVGVVAAVWEQQWLAAVITSGIILVTLVPLFLSRRFSVFIPPEFVLLAITFVFASVFLGEVHGYYVRFWWWDLVLHTGSGFLLGIIGFLLVYILNETEDIDVSMQPGFIAFFAFLFAVGIGVFWEIFEFSMDSYFGMNMQKEMLGDPSGLTDTMWDLIVDAAGALIIAVLGYGYIKTANNESFLERWIDSFIKTNPQFFGRHR